MNVLATQPKGLLGLTFSLLTIAVLAGGCAVQEGTVTDGPTIIGQPVMDERLSQDDFGFPSQPPSLVRGKEVFQAHCSACHVNNQDWQQRAVQERLAYTTPIDLYLMLSRGSAPQVTLPSEERRQVLPTEHPSFQDALSRDQRWEALFYARYLAGAGDFHNMNNALPDGTNVASIFGGNCAVCHGKRGIGDGPLHLGQTGNHDVHDAVVKHLMEPPPANFRDDYRRMYNRTDAQLFKYVCEGIYPSAMPAWFGNVHRDPQTNTVDFVFDSALIWNLVRHVRQFSYHNDLPPEEEAPNAFTPLRSCDNVPTNQPWTELMQEHRPQSRPSGDQAPTQPQLQGRDQT